MSRPVRLMLPVAIAVVAVAVALIASGGAGPKHTLKARFAAALDVTRGQEVRLAGSDVGSVSRVSADGNGALVTLKVDDDVWPLPAGTRARLRWGSTTAYEGRFVQLEPQGAGRLADGAVLPRSQTTAPVEFDQMYSILNAATRPKVQSLVGDLSASFEHRAPALRSALEQTPDGLENTSQVLAQLSRDRYALQTLVQSGADATSAIASQDPALRDIVTHAAGTFDEFADQAAPIQASLDLLPGTLQHTRGGLARLDQSVPGLQSLVHDLAPGASRLRVLAPELLTTTQRLRTVAPIAGEALASANANAAPITHLLSAGTPFAARTSSALRTFAPMAGCLRPYGPEIASFLATWAGYTARYDANGHYARALPPVQPVPHGTPLDSADALKLTPPGSVSYAMPRPPGYTVGQTWFQPQCGAGPDALDAAKDPEAR